MNVLFQMPTAVRERCFADEDLHRLTRRHEVLAAGYTDAAERRRQWQELAPTAEALVTGWESAPLTAAMLDRAPRLRVILHAAGSVKHLLPESVWERGIRVGTANEALAIGVAETTLGLIIAGLKGFFPASRLTRDGGWKTDAHTTPGFQVRELYRTTVGIIGLSKVGRHVLRLLRHFEVRVLVADPTLDLHEAEALGVERVTLSELMRQSDVVTLHAPSIPQTRRMLDAAAFGLMKDGAIFINTARGAIVDEAALAAELRTGRIWAFLDVTDPEPPAPDHPFRTLPNVILTPHIAGAISNGCFRLGRWVVEQLDELADHEPLRGEVAREQLATMA